MDRRIQKYLFMNLDERDARKVMISSYAFWSVLAGFLLFGLVECLLNTPFILLTLFFDIVVIVVGVILLSVSKSSGKRLNVPSGHGDDTSGMFLFHLSDDVRLYKQCVNIITRENCQSISLGEMKAALPDYSGMSDKEFRRQVGLMCARKWFRHGRIIGDTLCVTRSAKEYAGESGNGKDTEKAKRSTAEWELVMQNALPDEHGYLFATVHEEDVRKVIVSAVALWGTIAVCCGMLAAENLFGVPIPEAISSAIYKVSLVVTIVSFFVNGFAARRLHIAEDDPCDVFPDVSSLLLYHLRRDVRLYEECAMAITEGNCQRINIGELQASIPDASGMDGKEFRKQIGYMCARKWFRHGRIVGNDFCVTDSASEYVRGMEDIGDVTEQEYQGYLRKEWELAAQNVLPETFGDAGN